jgi:uncharacterized repeat protein (TIGR02543 family)
MQPIPTSPAPGRRARFLILTAVAAALIAPAFANAADNYAEALQKSLYFYDAEKSGPGITGGRLEWRGDSEVRDTVLPLKPMAADNTGTNMSQAFITANRAVLDPDGNGTVDVSGGYHDAGDHVRFGLPQAYAASTLAWAYYEFKSAFVQTSQEAHMRELLKWFGDVYLRSTFRNAAGDVVAFAYQVGEGSVDHTVWAPPELLNLPRPAYFATSETKASDQAAAAAATLALLYLDFKDTDLAYANRCLDAAQALYRFAVANRGLGYSGGFYNSSDDADEMSWAAVWLYTATGQSSYLTDITAMSGTSYTGYLGKIIRSTQDNWQNIWVHSWDTVWGGVFVQLANVLPDDAKLDYYARWNLEYWSGGAVPHQEANDTNYLAYTPAGFGVINTWGSARYNAAAQMCALIYAKHKSRTDFAAWARGQMAYIMGANPMGYSYIVGYPTPELSAKHPHHRAAHGSTTNSMLDPPNHKHVLWGALVGGPDTADVHKDLTNDFVYNEVAIDYNAGLVGALAGLYTFYGAGQLPLASFPPAEPTEQAYTAKAKIEQENNQRSQITITMTAQPTHPPHFVRGLTARYFFNISELTAAGQAISAVTSAVYYDEQASAYGGSTVLRGPVAWDEANGVYYMELDWSANDVYGKRDLQLALMAAQDAQWKSNWDPTNDWSHQGLSSTASSATQYVPIYLDGVKVFGEEPPRGGGSTSFTLAVTKAGTGSGTVTSTPAGVSCGTTCSASYAGGTSVTLTAAPASGSTFAGWSGACTNTTGTCIVSMSAARTVTATFTGSTPTVTLTVTKSGTGSGTVTSTPAGVSCGTTCAAGYTSGTSVTLTAAAASGSTFAGWSGACTGTTATCTVSMTQARSVTAAFNLAQTGTFALTVTKSGTGSGTVTSTPAGVSCGATCSASYTSGTTVTLTAAAASGSTFAGWSGACTGTAATCTVSMTQARTATAAFNPAQTGTFALTVTKSGTGSGTVTSTPAGVSCGATCSASFASGASVTLSAAAAAGSQFTGWSGACTNTTPTCTVSMTQARTVTAAFSPAQTTNQTLTVTKAGTGSGTVTSTPAGVSCGSTCTASYASGTSVTLSAAAASGSTFAGWSGACTNTTGTCTVSMTAARAVTATFNPSSTTTAPCANARTMASGQSGNFDTTGALCLRTSATVYGWGCSNFQGRTVSVNGGTAAATCGGGSLPLAKWSDGYTYFSISAGTYSWASLYYW